MPNETVTKRFSLQRHRRGSPFARLQSEMIYPTLLPCLQKKVLWQEKKIKLSVTLDLGEITLLPTRDRQYYGIPRFWPREGVGIRP